MNYGLLYDMISEEIPKAKAAYFDGEAYQDCKTLAALYEVLDYAANMAARHPADDPENDF